MFHLVVGNNEIQLRGKTLEDRGLDGRFDGTPGSNRIGVISPGSTNFVEEIQSTDNSGEALFVMQKTQNIFPGRMVWG